MEQKEYLATQMGLLAVGIHLRNLKLQPFMEQINLAEVSSLPAPLLKVRKDGAAKLAALKRLAQACLLAQEAFTELAGVKV